MSIPVPQARVRRYEELFFGLQMHWGLYSLLGEGEWIMSRKKIPATEYNKLADRFMAEKWNPRAIARLAKEAGMRYITLTTRHHDGFSLYDTRGLSKFDAPHSAAKRDLVAEFVEGCRAEGLIPFFYHTTLDWQWDSANCVEAKFNEYLEYLRASVEVLCTQYGPIGGLRFDGNWSRWDADWKEDRLYDTIRKHQPEAIIINNPGTRRVGHVTNPNLDVSNFEQHGIRPIEREGDSKYRAGTLSQTLNNHWGYGKLDLNYKSPAAVIETIARCLRCGATYLLNVGPLASGEIPEMDAATLRTIGKWMKAHEAAVYGAKPVEGVDCGEYDFVCENEGRHFYFVHRQGMSGPADAFVKTAGADERTISGFAKPVKRIRWLVNDADAEFRQDAASGTITVKCGGNPYGTNLVVRVAEILL